MFSDMSFYLQEEKAQGKKGGDDSEQVNVLWPLK